ncbi:MAG TPA: M56 family metallopeptidase, partial [Planctomycetaceae bacterium]|nr:M56 family metallopeptidase [Planctomycetaceae bacterium]
MKSTDALRACLTLFSSHPLLERLFFASVEFAVLAVLVFGVIRVGRIRSARLASLLWLLVLAKPLVSLAIGSPLPLVRMKVAPAVIAASTAVDRAAHVDPQTSVAQPMAGETQASRLPADDLDDMAATGFAQPAPETTSAETTRTATTPPIASAPRAQSVSSSRPWNPATILLTIWLTGTAGFAGLSLLDRVRVLRLVHGAQLPDASLSARYHAVVSQLGLKRPVRLRITTALEGPALVGSVFPTILIPAWLADDSNHARLDWALRHELMHWKLLDPFASLVRELAQILFYFHPAAWWAGRQWEISAERACDRAIVTNDLDSHAYAEQLYGILVGMQGRLRARIGNGLFATRTQIGQRIAALLNGPRTPHPHLSALALVIVTLVAAVTLSIGGAFADKHLKGHDSEKPDDSQNTTAVALAEKPPEKPAAKPAQASPAVIAPASASRAGAAEPKPANTADVAFTYAGTVVDDHGKPVAGAKLAFDYWHMTYPADGLPVLAVSDSQGRFQFSRRKSDFSDAGSTGPWWFLAMIVATKEGYGLAGGPSIQFETTGKLAEEQHRPPGPRPKDWTNVLKLAADDVPIHGRILDTEGRPVAGARVQAINAWAGRDGTLESWERAAQQAKAGNWRPLAKLRALNFSFAPFVPRPALVPAVRTDATGWFTLKGIGRERLADVAVSGAGIETMLLHVRSRRGTIIELPSPYQIRDPRVDSYYPCEFTRVA